MEKTGQEKIKPYWAKIFYHFIRRGYIYNGLTLPFLIGAEKVMDTDATLYSISEILEKFSRYEMPVTVMRCGNIGEYVFGIMDTEDLNHKNLYREINNIFVTDNSLAACSTLSDLIDTMEGRYNGLLDKQFYSRLNGKWESFSNIDIERIKETTAN